MDRRITQLRPDQVDNWDGDERRIIRYAYHPVYPWRWRLLTAWIILFSALTVWTLSDLNATRRENCERISRILTSEIAGLNTTLGTPAAPLYDYYRAHPNELILAKAQNRNLAHRLSPDRCK